MVGGLLLSPRSSQTQAPGADGATPSAADASAGAVAGDLSPRAAEGDQAAIDPANPSGGDAAGALPGEVSLAALFPSEAAMGAESSAAGTLSPLTQRGEVAAPSAGSGNGSHNRAPLVAGLVVTLVILLAGAGFVWWRNRDSRYWPA